MIQDFWKETHFDYDCKACIRPLLKKGIKMNEHEQRIYNRHGEIGLFAILENWERAHGVKWATATDFEIRWAYFIRETNKLLLAA
jgi:hypothetical protein